MKARILVLAPSYSPSKDGVAGAATLMAEGLAARGCEVLVGTLWHPERKAPGADDNPRVHQFRVQGSPSWREGLSGETEELRRFALGFGGDIVFCHCLDAAPTILALYEFGRLEAAKVLVSHGYQRHLVPWRARFPWGLGFWAGWQPFVWRLPWQLRRFERLVFLSERRDFGRFFDHRVARLIRHPGIRIIPNAVDRQETLVGPLRFRLAHGLEGRFLFICVANYGDRKDQLLALRAYRAARVPNSTLVFIGSEFNEYSRRLEEVDKELARQRPAGRVLLLEKQDRPTTEAALREMDALVLSAKQETQPIVLLEAMAARKPFLTTDTGCVRELAGGIVVENEAQMSQQLRRLANEPELRTRLAEEGHRDYEQKYRKEAVLDAYEALVSELLSA